MNKNIRCVIMTHEENVLWVNTTILNSFLFLQYLQVEVVEHELCFEFIQKSVDFISFTGI